MATISVSNPLLSDWSAGEFALPPFFLIQPSDFKSAFEQALCAHVADITKICSTDIPTFENTALPLDVSGQALDDISKVFSTLCSSNTSPELQQVEMDMAPILAAHSSKVYMFPGLFARVDAVHEARMTSGLTPEQVRLVERLHLDFVRAGARFDEAAKVKYAQIMEKLAALQTTFSQNILADESDFTIQLKVSDFGGCPADLIAAARQAAVERNLGEGCYVITLSRSLVEPFLTFSNCRKLREKAWRAWTKRGELDSARDNLAVAGEILRLRAEQGAMHGYPSFGAYQTADTMAKTPQRVMELLETVWPKAKLSADRERAALQAFIASQPATNGEMIDTIEPWDWRYYSELVRTAKYDFDEAALKPYLSLDSMVAAVFDVAHQLFGLTFVPRPDLKSYHPDVATYEVHESVEGKDKLVAIFLHDNFARMNKISGAWMSELRTQNRSGGNDVLPVITNNNNFARGSDGEPTLLSFDDATTLFHEFGHGCHGMLSNVTYKNLAGTSVLRDFVELPSQLMEHWLSEPEVLKKHARHYKTGEPIPDELLAKLKAARAWNKGFETIEYTASALVDQALHALGAEALSGTQPLDIGAFEKSTLDRLGMPQGIIMRHRPAHFQHLFSSSSYAAAYYVYLWAEVLDADGFDAFLETKDCFHKETADRVRKFIYSTGNTLEPGAAFRAFRGRDPVVEPMLAKKGLVSAE